jgi:hypothetical protein
MEIYRENVLDLLSAKSAMLKIQEVENNEVVVKGLTEHNVHNPEEIFALMRQGEAKRTYGETNMNERSSRSHTVFRITVESREAGGVVDCAVVVSFN